MSTYIRVGAGAAPIGATLMKTGQTTSYRTGDDGDIEAGRGINFFTLNSNNPFNNDKRFTDVLGLQTYATAIVIDWSTYNGSTVLGYNRQLTLGGYPLWNGAIDFAATLTIGDYSTGWRLTNIYELINVFNYELANPYFFSPFTNNPGNAGFWTSTTRKDTTTQVLVSGAVGNIGVSLKTTAASFLGRYVRNFTVTGTTLT